MCVVPSYCKEKKKDMYFICTGYLFYLFCRFRSNHPYIPWGHEVTNVLQYNKTKFMQSITRYLWQRTFVDSEKWIPGKHVTCISKRWVWEWLCKLKPYNPWSEVLLPIDKISKPNSDKTLPVSEARGGRILQFSGCAKSNNWIKLNGVVSCKLNLAVFWVHLIDPIDGVCKLAVL